MLLGSLSICWATHFSILVCFPSIKLPGHSNPYFSMAKVIKDTISSWLPLVQMESEGHQGDCVCFLRLYNVTAWIRMGGSQRSR